MVNAWKRGVGLAVGLDAPQVARLRKRAATRQPGSLHWLWEDVNEGVLHTDVVGRAQPRQVHLRWAATVAHFPFCAFWHFDNCVAVAVKLKTADVLKAVVQEQAGELRMPKEGLAQLQLKLSPEEPLDV
jgi:hypothetical protein